MRSGFFVTLFCLLSVLGFHRHLMAQVGIVMESGPEFQVVEKSVSSILEDEDIKVLRFKLSKDAKYSDFLKFVKSKNPEVLVLMDNRAMEFGKQLAKEKDPVLNGIKSVAAMGLNLKTELKNDKNISGVAFEVPAYTILTNFRSLVKNRKLENVLVIYRHDQFALMVEEAKRQLDREGIRLIAIDASDQPAGKLKSFLSSYLKPSYQGIRLDAILVITDSKLMNQKTFSSVWVSKARSLKIPMLCGIKKFVSPEFNFCSYASFPDHVELGAQISQMVFSLLDGESTPEELGVEYILSVQQAVNEPMLKNMNIELKPDAKDKLIKSP
ncbi:MAG: hypothetical protein HRU19_02535 [Pseudobacteriovorax sp.]|nr:hypothetical protein [Pseudobacteriovorax sp.]